MNNDQKLIWEAYTNQKDIQLRDKELYNKILNSTDELQDSLDAQGFNSEEGGKAENIINLFDLAVIDVGENGVREGDPDFYSDVLRSISSKLGGIGFDCTPETKEWYKTNFGLKGII